MVSEQLWSAPDTGSGGWRGSFRWEPPADGGPGFLIRTGAWVGEMGEVGLPSPGNCREAWPCTQMVAGHPV